METPYEKEYLSARVERDHRNPEMQSRNLSPEKLSMHIERCVLNNRESQKIIYTSFYRYCKVICDRYSNNEDDSIEILNDGFLKIFKMIHRFSPAYSDVGRSFKSWLGKIMKHTAINHFRKNRKHSLINIEGEIIRASTQREDAFSKIYYKEIIRSVSRLTPVYKTVFNLFIIEGFTHKEISTMIGISIGTSKSNLAKAKRQLKKILFLHNKTACSE